MIHIVTTIIGRVNWQVVVGGLGGLEIFESTLQEFSDAITAENHTLKRALTDPKVVSGIGNAYSDEILYRARLSPILLTKNLSDEQLPQLYSATKETLLEWTERLRVETGEGFPKNFHESISVHGRFGTHCDTILFGLYLCDCQ